MPQTAVRPTSNFRPDIEGLRALAIGLVLLFHAGLPWVPGGFVGVDVFFVISGFLITGMLIREIETTGRVSLSNFWARRAKRLFPASVLVLGVTALATWLIAPITVWRSVGADISAAALYLVNWRFAIEAVDYNAEGTAVSPVLHYWSLAVEEQFYIIWPLLLVGLAFLFLRRGASRRTRPVIGSALAAIVVASLVWSIVFTRNSPETAFFVTTTRLWELGIGALVAVGASHWHRIPTIAASLLGWLGLAAVIASALMFSEADAWPGARALVPVLGTAAMIVAGTGREIWRGSVGRLLAFRPFVWVGALSYSWYLWHWPVLVLAEAQFGELRLRYTLLLALGSGVLAWLSLHFVENPIRRAPVLAKNHWLALSGGVNLSLVGMVVGLALVLAVPSASTTPTGATAQGARALAESGVDVAGLADVDRVKRIVPSPADATEDLPSTAETCVSRTSEVITCDFGDVESDVRIAVVGDSKIQQMSDAFQGVAEARRWHIRSYFKSACAFADPQWEQSDDARRDCAQWNDEVVEMLLADPPQFVVTGIRGVIDGTDAQQSTAPGAKMLADQWEKLRAAGIEVVPYLDNPDSGREVYECVAEHMDTLSACAFERENGFAISGRRYQLPAMELSGIDRVIDLSESICPVAERCPAVIGNVLVYRQGSHITNTYAKTLTDVLMGQLEVIVALV